MWIFSNNKITAVIENSIKHIEISEKRNKRFFLKELSDFPIKSIPLKILTSDIEGNLNKMLKRMPTKNKRQIYFFNEMENKERKRFNI